MPDHLTVVPAADRSPAATDRGLTTEDEAALAEAVRVLEHSTLVGRLSAMAGRPLELLGRSLPAPAQEAVSRATELALKAALRVALKTLDRPDGPTLRLPKLDTALAAASGALGGAFGLASLPVELPVSTTVMLRAIANIAREEGEDLSDPEAALACLQVFALGSQTEADDPARSGYFAVRGMLAKSVTDAARLAARGLGDSGAPTLARFVAGIASRFGGVVSQKVAAGAVPVLGAIGGAALNAAFVEHFRTIARAHFTVRRLERSHGAEAVAAAYEAIRSKLAA